MHNIQCFDLETERNFTQFVSESKRREQTANMLCVFVRRAASHTGVLSEGIQIIVNLILGQIYDLDWGQV